MKKYFWCVFLLLPLFCFGCGHLEGYLNIMKDESISKEYLNVLNLWTRDETVYSQFETRVHIVATYKNREFNKAYISEYSRIHSLTEPERRKKEQILTDISSDFTEFLFYAYTPEKEPNDFDRQNSIWKIFLLDEKGNRMYPVEVRKIKKITPIIEEFYPYVKRYYGMFYSLKFPPTEEGNARHLRLVFASVLGRVELEWKM